MFDDDDDDDDAASTPPAVAASGDNTPAISTDEQTDLPEFRPAMQGDTGAQNSFSNYQQLGLTSPQSSPDAGDDYVPVPGTSNGAIPVEDDATGVNQQVQAQGDQPDLMGSGEPNPNILKMLQGEGAVNPATLQQINEQARRGLHDTPADTGVYAIEDALNKHGPDAAAALVQANRVNYDTATATAFKALSGTGQKRPDLNRAIAEANRAQDFMPDGSNVIFSPNGNHGVIAVVTPPGQQHSVQYNLSIPQFKQFLDVGKDGQFDNMFNAGVPGMLQRLSNAQAEQNTDGTPVKDADEGGDNADAKNPNTRGESEFGEGPSKKWLGVASRMDKDGNFAPQDRPGYNAEGNKVGAKDATDADEDDTQPAPRRGRGPGDGKDQDIADAQRRAFKLFPWMSQARQRAAFIQQEINAQSQNEAKLEQERVKGVNWTDRQRLINEGHMQTATANNQSKEKIAEGRNATWRYATDQKAQAAAQRLAQAAQHEQQVNQRADRANYLRNLARKATSGEALSDEEQRIASRYGAAASQSFDAGGGNAPQAQAPAARTSSPTQVVEVSSPAEAHKLAPGTVYKTPDGRKFTR